MPPQSFMKGQFRCYMASLNTNSMTSLSVLVLEYFKLFHRIPVASLQRHLWSYVCSKFHENRCILKSMSRNRDTGVFLI